MRGSLSTPIKIPNQYLNSDSWVMQQKLDGWRVLVRTGEKLQVYNRDGHGIDINKKHLGMLNNLKTEWLFDGEYQKQLLKEYTETKEQNKLLAKQVNDLTKKVESIPALERAVKELTEGVHTLTEQLLDAGISPAFKAPKF